MWKIVDCTKFSYTLSVILYMYGGWKGRGSVKNQESFNWTEFGNELKFKLGNVNTFTTTGSKHIS